MHSHALLTLQGTIPKKRERMKRQPSLYSATCQAWYASVMTSSSSTLVLQFADMMKQLNETLVC
jgi:hypothetical protein